MTRLKLNPKSSALERKFEHCWLAVHGPPLIREFKFDARRRWRFDFAHSVTRAAIEIEGGQWSGGRHTRGGGFAGDCEKYNAAALQGWHVFRLTRGMITVPWCECLVDWIEERTPALDGPAAAVHVSRETSNAQRVIEAVRELLMQPINQRLAAQFYAGVFSLGWAGRRRAVVTVPTKEPAPERVPANHFIPTRHES